jgi:hypothetical protein
MKVCELVIGGRPLFSRGGRARSRRSPLVLCAATMALLVHCTAPDLSAPVNRANDPADLAAFASVHPVILQHCGTMDCHGNAERNFRVYGFGGLRESPTLDPLRAKTSEGEVTLTHLSLVGLEPNQTLDASATFLRKALGGDNHHGGNALDGAADSEACLRAWLAGTELSRCEKARP